MMGTIALVTILSAILVFFVDELSAYAKALVARPYIFLIFGLLTLSALADMHTPAILWLLITWWISLLLVVQWLADHLFGNSANQFLAKWVVVVVVAVMPIVLALRLDAYKRTHAFYNKDTIKKRGYMLGLVMWVFTLLLFVLGLPGSDLSG